MKRLPFEPQSEAALFARYHDAISETCDGSWWPGHYRRHVFDFNNGLRVIISRDNIPDSMDSRLPMIGIHVSASIENQWPLWKRIFEIMPSKRERWFRKHVEGVVASMFGIRGMQFRGFSDGKGVPHWCKETKRKSPK